VPFEPKFHELHINENEYEATIPKDDTSTRPVRLRICRLDAPVRCPPMMALLQRVSQARVTVGGEVVGEIGAGLLVLVCAEPGDTCVESDKLLAKILKLRIFSDTAGKMNHSLQNMDGAGQPESSGGLLLVSQFTLAADATRGNRPSYTNAALPEDGKRIYDYFVSQARLAHPVVQTGVFAADMQVSLVNDGPVTIPLRIVPPATRQDNSPR
jgi:D-tyrosyl-tRNA(Tyr) deacylase